MARRQTANRTQPEHDWRPILFGTLALTFVVYIKTLTNEFVDFDDPENIIGNTVIHELSWANLGYYFSHPLQYMYTPLVYLSYAFDYRLGGADPTMYHVTNLGLHLANVALVFFVFHALTRNAFVSHAVALAFAIHPVNVDAVSWVSTRSNLLAAFFYLLALLGYLRYLSTERLLFLGLSAGAFLLAALAKSPAVVLPLTLFLVDYYRRRRWSWRLLLEKVPFGLIALAIGLVALRYRVDTVNPYGYDVLDRIVVFCVALVGYLVRLVVPVHLSFAYEYPETPLPWYFYLAPVGLLLGGWLLWRIRSARRVVVFGLGFFLINIGLSQSVLLIDNYTANRYAYLSYLGLFLILAHFAEPLVRRVPAPQVAAVAGVLILLFGTVSVVRTVDWRNTNTIMSDAIAKEPGVPFLHNSRGIWRYRTGDHDGALRDFQDTVALDPTFALSHFYMGEIKYQRQQYQEALRDYDTILATLWNYAPAYNGRGKTRQALKDDIGAAADFTEAIRYDPGLIEAYYHRGTTRLNLADNPGAYDDLNTAIALFPNYADAYYRRGEARLRLGDATGACADWRYASTLGQAQSPQAITQNCPAG